MYIYLDIYEIKDVPYLYVACKNFDVDQITLLIKVKQTLIYEQIIKKEDLDIHGIWCKPLEEIEKYPLETLWFYCQIQDREYYLQKMKYCERKSILKEKVAYLVVKKGLLEFKELIEMVGERYE